MLTKVENEASFIKKVNELMNRHLDYISSDMTESYKEIIDNDRNNPYTKDFFTYLDYHSFKFQDIFKNKFQEIYFSDELIHDIYFIKYIKLLNFFVNDIMSEFDDLYNRAILFNLYPLQNLEPEIAKIFNLQNDMNSIQSEYYNMHRKEKMYNDSDGYTLWISNRSNKHSAIIENTYYIILQLTELLSKYKIQYHISRELKILIPNSNEGIESTLGSNELDRDYYLREVENYKKIKLNTDNSPEFYNSLRSISVLLDNNLSRLFSNKFAPGAHFTFNRKEYERLFELLGLKDKQMAQEILTKQLNFIKTNIHHSSSNLNPNSVIYPFTNFEYNYWWNFMNSMIDSISSK